MEKKRLVGLMIILAIIGVIAGYFRLGGKIAEKINNIFMLMAGIYFVNLGIKLDKESPDKTIRVFKPVKIGKFLKYGGVTIFILSFILLIVG